MPENNLPIVKIYTDGACSGNPGPGGWGAYLIFQHNTQTTIKKISGSIPYTTNNKMELLAAIEALKCLKRKCKVMLYTDSSYVQKGITDWINNWRSNNWLKARKASIKNLDLWMKLDTESAKHQICWYWVKGHSGVEGNEIADQLAVRAKEKAKLL